MPKIYSEYDLAQSSRRFSETQMIAHVAGRQPFACVSYPWEYLRSTMHLHQSLYEAEETYPNQIG